MNNLHALWIRSLKERFSKCYMLFSNLESKYFIDQDLEWFDHKKGFTLGSQERL